MRIGLVASPSSSPNAEFCSTAPRERATKCCGACPLNNRRQGLPHGLCDGDLHLATPRRHPSRPPCSSRRIAPGRSPTAITPDPHPHPTHRHMAHLLLRLSQSHHRRCPRPFKPIHCPVTRCHHSPLHTHVNSQPATAATQFSAGMSSSCDATQENEVTEHRLPPSLLSRSQHAVFSNTTRIETWTPSIRAIKLVHQEIGRAHV